MSVPLAAIEFCDREPQRFALFQEEMCSNRYAINQWSIDSDEASRVASVPTFQPISSPLRPLAGGWGPLLRDKKSMQNPQECKQQ